MTPQERDLVNELFERLATLERSPREPEAERAIKDGLQRAPNAVYALVQTVLVQDEALKRADAHIQELEAQLNPQTEPPRSGGFLDNMRGALFGQKDTRSSVPQVPPSRQDAPTGAPSRWGTGGYNQAPQGSGAPGGYNSGPAPTGVGTGSSFLGTMAASAAGMIGGSLLLSGISSMMSGDHRSGFGSSDMNAGLGGGQSMTSPWSSSGGDGGGGGSLSRDAGLDDIGRNAGGQQGSPDSDRGFGLFGGNSTDDGDSGSDVSSDSDFGDSSDSGFDGGGGGGGDD